MTPFQAVSKAANWMISDLYAGPYVTSFANPLSKQERERSEIIHHAVTQMLERAAREYATPESPLTVTDEVGEPKCLVIAPAEYSVSDHCPDGDTDHCECPTYAGFLIRWPDGREEVVGSLRSDFEDYFGVGCGPWDGQHYTLIQRDSDRVEPEFEMTDEDWLEEAEWVALNSEPKAA
jgi:hypothetical protein